MNNKWLPWILTTLIGIGMAYATYTNARMDRQTESQLGMHKEYVTRLEYNKDYAFFCGRFDRLDNLMENIDKKMDRMRDYLKNNK
uniref:Uncharacterized protein n=1 Tax=viral metagenome TaxID=1070528 RepID=A0A6H1Z9Z6_9ZZZZ